MNNEIKRMTAIIGNVKPFYVETIAEALYNAGYRKVDKDSVILTKEEYIDLSRNYVKEQKAQAVKEFAEKLKEKYGHYWCYLYKKDLKQLRTIIDELLKEYEE